MLVTASISSEFAAAVGLLAATIAVLGFLAHARPVLAGASEEESRRAMARGGLAGFGVGASVIVLSAIFE